MNRDEIEQELLRLLMAWTVPEEFTLNTINLETFREDIYKLQISYILDYLDSIGYDNSSAYNDGGTCNHCGEIH